MQINYKKSFVKSYQKLDVKIKTKVKTAIEIFINNPFEDILNNHQLNGKYNGYNSISVTGDYRIVFIEKSGGNYEFVEFIDVGTHSKLY